MEVAHETGLIFGDYIGNIDSQRRFVIEADDMNTTFRHIDDGDNTIGWIEEVNNAAELDSGYKGEGRVVADIGDGDIGNCQVLE